MQKEFTAEEREQYRPRVIIDLKIVVNRGDVPIVMDPYAEYDEVDGPDNDVENDCSTKIKELTEENRVLREKLSKLENS